MRNNFFEKHDLIIRYEDLIRNQKTIYFDLDEFFEISNYYAWQDDCDGALIALSYAEFCFPNEQSVKLAIINVMLNNVSLDEATDYLQELKERYANNLWVMVRIAIFYLAESKLDLTEQILDQVTLLDTDEDVYAPILNILRGEDLDLQIKYLQKALDQRITEQDYVHLGECYVEKEQFETAEVYFQKALDLDSFNLNTWDSLGDLYLKMEKIEHALHAFEMCLTIDEDVFHQHIKKGSCLLKLDRKAELASFIASTIEFWQETTCEEDIVALHCAFANMYMDHGEWEIAVTELKKIIYFYESGKAESYLAKCFVQLGDFERAMVHIDKAISLNYDDEGEYWKIKGMVYTCTEAFNETLFCFFLAKLFHCSDIHLLQMFQNVAALSSFEEIWATCVERNLNADLLRRIKSHAYYLDINDDPFQVKLHLIIELSKLFSQINEPESVIKCVTILTTLDTNATRVLRYELENPEHFNLLCEAIPEFKKIVFEDDEEEEEEEED